MDSRGLLLAIGLLMWGASAAANERHFTYTYESAVLPPDVRELEVWSTDGIGRDQTFNGFDERFEFEVGLTDRLQSSIYVNFGGQTQRVGSELVSGTHFDGISNEWKYKLWDAVADPVGVALYGELLAAPQEGELELKVILDKELGPVLMAANLVLENDLEFNGAGAKFEFKPELDLAASYFFTSRFAAGLEARSVTVLPAGAPLEYSGLFAGPVVSYVRSNWWVALTVLPQLPAPHPPSGSRSDLVLTDYEKFSARLLFSFQL